MRRLEATVAIVLGLILMFAPILSSGLFGQGNDGTATVIGAFILLVGVIVLAFKKDVTKSKLCRVCGKQLPEGAAYCDRCGNIAR